jgi:predicted GNAT family acetyltransferase
VRVARLTERHTAAIQALLLDDPLVNLFLLGYVEAVGVHRAYWYGVLDGEAVRALVLLVPGRLMVPWAPDPDDAARLGDTLRRRHRPCMVVGPREASDAAWRTWAPDATIDKWHDQRLYVSDVPPRGEDPPGFRRAVPADAEVLVRQSAAMELEDIGRRAFASDPAGYAAVVRRRIDQGQTWVIERDGRIAFQINVGTTTPHGAQVGGTYVPPDLRGHGLARAGMEALGRRLLPHHGRLTLHVNEANAPAVRTYERSGYRPHAAYRLITLRER